MDYKAAGVDVEAGYKSIELMKGFVAGTYRPEVIGGLGGFAGAFALRDLKGMDSPTLISATDGVGTKLKLAFILDRHDTVGIDCVAMSVNDLACAGGDPLFFLDYIACGRNVPERIAQIVKGVAAGCIQAGAALIGGETAEHPGLMPEDEYDLAGFAVGLVEEKDIITGADIAPGDALVGLASSGVHSNGFSLIRKVFDMSAASLHTHYDCLGTTLGEALLAPTKIYVRALRSVKESGVVIKGCSHITGGGFQENIPRMLPEGVCAIINNDSYDIPPIFGLIQETGGLSREVMYNTYNMGLGMVLAVAPTDAEKTVAAIEKAGEKAYIVGHIAEKGGGESKGDTLCLC
jgi:phosphoribosylformylglycinamidine cyclo-ligase